MAQRIRVPKTGIHWSVHAAMRSRTGLMAHVGMVAALHSELEHQLALLFVDILGPDRKLGLSIYLELRSENAPRDTIMAAAEIKLTKES
jgi:hypothetical protein